jgi:hypothetical protein
MQLNVDFREQFSVRWLVIGMNSSLLSKEMDGDFYMQGTQVKGKVHPRTGHEGPDGE